MTAESQPVQIRIQARTPEDLQEAVRLLRATGFIQIGAGRQGHSGDWLAYGRLQFALEEFARSQS